MIALWEALRDGVHPDGFEALSCIAVGQHRVRLLNMGFWQLIFRGVLLPIFDNVRYASGADLLQEVGSFRGC